YTKGITDINYIDSVLPLMLSANGILFSFKWSSLCLINVSFNAKKAMPRTLLEAAINLILTLIFVPIWGIRGALLGTGIALVYRVIDLLFYANRKILEASVKKPLILYVSNFLVFLTLYMIGTKQWYTVNTYFDLFLYAIIVFTVTSAVFVVLNFIIDIGQAKTIYKYTYSKIKSLKGKNV
nr:polysaccharide biosynthesis C-terminal domain-containing protein [Bacillota bacterium]